ncbi:MAG TPA: hypothetical protein VFV72_01170 [Candidatus Limnocylindrales bacterium]|nr:hypothetical protein [Candidatus Limnocylindrales bacterium]
MNASSHLERRLADYYASDSSPRAPDWVLGAALATIDTTPQRRAFLRVPWRFPTMNTFAKVAVAVVAVIAVGAVGLAVLRPAAPSSGVGGSPSRPPSQDPDPSAPPPLDPSFTSTINGITLQYPSGWTTAPATEPWTPTSPMSFESAAADHIYDPQLRDHLFLTAASQPLGGKAGDTWVTDFMADSAQGCAAPTQQITIDGASGEACSGLAAVAAGGRGYFVRLYASSDDAWLANYYDDAWFRQVLDTVQLDPGAAVDASPSAVPSAR